MKKRLLSWPIEGDRGSPDRDDVGIWLAEGALSEALGCIVYFIRVPSQHRARELLI